MISSAKGTSPCCFVLIIAKGALPSGFLSVLRPETTLCTPKHKSKTSDKLTAYITAVITNIASNLQA